MRRTLSPIGVGLVLLAASACAGERSTSTPTTPSEPADGLTTELAVVATLVAQPQAKPVASPTAEVTVTSETPLALSFDVPDVQPIGELSSELASAADVAEYRVGVVVLDLERNVAYAGGDGEGFALASVSKLALALGVLRRAELEVRELTWGERDQLALMLSESKNGPAVELWADLGADAVSEALSSYGLSGFWMPPDEQWGDMAASATDVAMLMRLFVADGSPLREDDRVLVLSLLQSVVAEQRWGVSAGIDISDQAGAVLAVKNGWYPEDEIWRVNSAGALTVAGETDYVMVVLSDGAPDFPRGVRGIEEIAATANRALYPEELVVALPEFVPAPESELVAPLVVDETDADQALDDVPTAEPVTVRFVALEESEDVLIFSRDLLTSETSEESFAIWFEVPESEVEALLGAYLGSMRGLGWTALSGPPDLLLSKQDEGRFVAVTPLPSAPGGTQVIEFRIAPVPAPTVSAATVE